MNHKEEAIKRVEEFEKIEIDYHKSHAFVDVQLAKQCALLAIKNEMDLLNLVYKKIGADYDNALIENLRLIGFDLIEVKKEIELL